MSDLFAHVGHWLLNVAYLAPLVVMLTIIGWGKLKDRRTQRPGAHPVEDDGL